MRRKNVVSSAVFAKRMRSEKKRKLKFHLKKIIPTTFFFSLFYFLFLHHFCDKVEREEGEGEGEGEGEEEEEGF